MKGPTFVARFPCSRLWRGVELVGARRGGEKRADRHGRGESRCPGRGDCLGRHRQNVRGMSGRQPGVALAVAWQVIQIESASVQSGTSTIAVNATTATAVLGTPVDASRTFLVFSQNGGTAIGGDETLYRVTGEITNATTLTFRRATQTGAGNTQINVAWFAVRMTDGTSVQRNLCGPSGLVATMPATPAGCLTLAPAIVPTRSVAFISASGDAASGLPTADLDDTSWKSALAAGAITLTRSAGASNSSNATVAWQVVQFNDRPNLVDGDGREIFP